MPDYGAVLTDIKQGMLAWELWGRLGWRETRLRYQRTVLGPFWATLSLGIFVVVMGLLWSQLWNLETKNYLPFLTAGLITWLLFSALATEGCATFSASELLVKQLRISYTMLACSIVWKNLIIFAHNLAIYIMVFIYGGKPLTWAMLLVIPGLILLALNGVWIALVLGLVCARYRDIQQLVISLLQISMFVTPIFWAPEQLRGRFLVLVDYNILYQYVEVVRGPLLGRVPGAWTYFLVAVATVGGWGLMLFLYARFRRRIAYWL